MHEHETRTRLAAGLTAVALAALAPEPAPAQEAGAKAAVPATLGQDFAGELFGPTDIDSFTLSLPAGDYFLALDTTHPTDATYRAVVRQRLDAATVATLCVGGASILVVRCRQMVPPGAMLPALDAYDQGAE